MRTCLSASRHPTLGPLTRRACALLLALFVSACTPIKTAAEDQPDVAKKSTADAPTGEQEKDETPEREKDVEPALGPASDPPAPEETAQTEPADDPPAEVDGPPTLSPTKWRADENLSGDERVALAKANKGDEVKTLFANAGLEFPPQQLLFRVFKTEQELEVWAADSKKGALKHVATHEICYFSGDTGPKRHEGDYQVPEGFYEISAFNKRSSYFLSMKVSYPNRSDRIIGQSNLGGDIMLHGNCVSIGCLAMSDERIQELWLMARGLKDANERDPAVYIFPARDLDALLGELKSPADDERIGFWTQLKEGNDRFEKAHTLLKVSIDKDSGAYWFD